MLDFTTQAVRRCKRCNCILDDASTDRVVNVHRTDNHYIEVCPQCAEILVAMTTHRRLQLPSEPDARD